MRIPVVFDACSLINLLRIDEDDEFLYKTLIGLDVHISREVYDEVKKNIFKCQIDIVKKKYLQNIIPSIENKFKIHENNDIVNDIGNSLFDKIIKYTNHTKKYNGELFSSILSLILSRFSESRICFYTDDLPAKKQFEDFFDIQHIGMIKDSIDCLLFLYWTQEAFQLKKLQALLRDLRNQYNKDIQIYINEVVRLKSQINRTQKEWKLLDDIEYAFHTGTVQTIIDKSNYLQESRNKKCRNLLKKHSLINSNNWLIIKVDEVLKYLENTDIYKLV